MNLFIYSKLPVAMVSPVQRTKPVTGDSNTESNVTYKQQQQGKIKIIITSNQHIQLRKYLI